MTSAPALLRALLLAFPAARAHPSDSHQALLSPDGESVFAADTNAEDASERGVGSQWLDQLIEVDPLGELRVFLTGGKKPFRQSVNGSTPTGPIQLGTPPVTLDVILDTGSDKLVAKTWDTVRRELKMMDRSAPDQVKPNKNIYNHNASSTYVPEYVTVKGVQVKKRGFVSYGSGIAITDEGKDTVSVAGHKLSNFTLSEITADSLTVLHSKKGVAGVLGLQHMKNRTLGVSVFTMMRDKGMLTSFGYCRGKKNSGTFIWGDTSTEGAKLPVVGQIHWALSLGNVTVRGGVADGKGNATARGGPAAGGKADKSGKKAGKSSGKKDNKETMKGGNDMAEGANGDQHSLEHLRYHGGLSDAYVMAKYARDAALVEGGNETSKGTSANQTKAGASKSGGRLALCPKGKCVAIIDTGSNIIAGPLESLKEISRRAGVRYDCSNLKTLPPMELHLGGQNVSLPGRSYVMKVKLPRLIIPSRQGKGGRQRSLLEQDDDEPLVAPAPANESEGMLSEVAQKMHEHLHQNYGLDLRTALSGIPVKTLLSGKTLCMPAFVPLDKMTTAGPLWVIGTPLFDKYYVRWSWPQDEESPSIFMKELGKAKTCKSGGTGSEDEGTAVKDPDKTPAKTLIRSETRGTSPPSPSPSPSPLEQVVHDIEQELPEWGAEEIRFPHWAKELDSL